MAQGSRLLDEFARLCPDTVPYATFCRNLECGTCKFWYRLPGDPEERKARACRFESVDGLEITGLSSELRTVLRRLLQGDPPGRD